ncbi:transposase [Methanococcoides seepicolus]|uniref:transposase n=1 Tax=Methanococcoides seepicolus TaxID=2828780 RepID=UPI00203246BC
MDERGDTDLLRKMIIDTPYDEWKKMEIEFLIYLPPYSPDLNPIEHICKSIKRVISSIIIIDTNHMKQLTFNAFIKYSSKISFAKIWIEKFVDED